MKRVICLLLALLSVLSAVSCGVMKEEPVEGLTLYGLTEEESRLGGDIISGETVVPWEALPEEREAQVQAVMERLMHSDGDYISPLPESVQLRSVSLSGSTACVDFSRGYAFLSGMKLTVADYCIVLSLTQLTGVYAVRITAEGREIAHRSKQLLLAGDVLLSSMDDVVRTLTATLVFFDEEGRLESEEQLLSQYEGESAAQVVLDALAEGPENDALLPLLPEGFVGMTARMESGVCHLNIPGESMALLEERETVLHAVALSLLSTEGIRQVELYVDGTPQGEIR
ncbi:MAG: GerMN domain-containing protein [Oscillospiraceae bacterium]|nr:GerMN domain-containing protein [Oscillospiraceae bacterium]